MKNSDPVIKLVLWLIVGLLVFYIIGEQRVGAQFAQSFLGIFSCLLIIIFSLKKNIYVPKTIAVVFGMFGIALLVTAYFSQVPEASVFAVIQYLGLLLLIIIGYNIARDDREAFEWFMRILVYGGSLYLSGVLIAGFVNGTIVAGSQLIGTFYWHNQLGGFVLFLIPLTVAFLLEQKKKVFLMVALVLQVVTLILTYSRGSWVSLVMAALAGLALFELPIGRYKKHILAGILGILVTGVVIGRWGLLGDRLSDLAGDVTLTNLSVSGNFRVQTYWSALEMARQYPLWGIGTGAFGEAFYVFQRVPWLYAQHAHNIVLEIVAEMGILGMIGMMGIVGGVGIILWRGLKNAKDQTDTVTKAVAIAVFASTLHAMLDIDWSRMSLASLFCLLVGLLIGRIFQQADNVHESNVTRGALLVSSMVLVVSLGGFVFTQQLKEADAFFTLERYDEALASLDRAETIMPFSYFVYQKRGHVYRAKNNPELGLTAYQQSQKHNPFSAEALYGQGFMLQALHRNDEALTLYIDAKNLNPYSHPRYYVAAALEFVNRNQYGDAEKVLSEMYTAFPQNDAFREYGALLRITGFKADLANAYQVYASILEHNGKPDQSRSVSEEVEELKEK